MKKLVAVSIRNTMESKNADQAKIIEIESVEKYLNDGYVITDKEIIVTPSSSVFTVIYQLEK